MTSPSTTSGRYLGEGKYELLTPIGLGAMGIVHLARHVALDRVVAIKLLNPGLTARPEAAERFLTEARTASLLRHKNTTHVLDFGGDQRAGFYLVMEYVEGRNLADVIAEEGTLPPARGIAIATQVLAALAEAHEFDIVHRDIKPGNIMIVPWTDDDGREVELVKVLDFGIATMHVEPRWAMKEEVAGTPEYMSPEQAQGMNVDPRSDVYAVGALLYTLVCGEVPFARETPMETMVAQVSSAPRSPRSLSPSLSDAFDRALLRALEKKPEDRYQSARAFRTALLELPEAAVLTTDAASVPAGLMASVPTTRPGIQPAVPAPPPPKKSRAWLFVVAALILVGGAGAVVGWVASGSGSSNEIVPEGTLAGVTPIERVPTTPPPVAATEATTVAARSDGADAVAEVVAEPTKPPETSVAIAIPAPGPTTVIEPPAPWPTLPPTPAPTEAAVADGVAVAPKPEPAEPKDRADTKDPKATKPDPKPETVAAKHTPAVVEPEKVTEVAPASVVAPKPEPEAIVPAEPIAPQPDPEPDPKPDPVVPADPITPKPEPALSASARIGGVAVEGSLPSSAVTRALDSARAGLEQCYRTAASAAHADAAGSAPVNLVIDIDGRARSVDVGPLPLPGLQACVAGVFKRVRTRDRPDTGTVGASFQLTFTPRPTH